MLIMLLFGVVAGLVVGWIHFAGLRWTVQRTARNHRRTAWRLASYGVRGLITLAAFLGLTRFGPAVVVGALLGFLAARWLATRFRGPLPVLAPDATEGEPPRRRLPEDERRGLPDTERGDGKA
ncbi:MAG: ATP synthase subunit I [Trueperaceae bacterium]|nr:ATP synthase subunit I [Trueperaceae bacterium]